MTRPSRPHRPLRDVALLAVASLAKYLRSNRRSSISGLGLVLLIACLFTATFFFLLHSLASSSSSSSPYSPSPALFIPPRALSAVVPPSPPSLEKKRVCIVTMEIGFSSPGGIGTAYTGLALKLVERGHNVTVLFVDDNRHTREEWITILSPLEELGLKIFYIEPMELTGCYYSCMRSYRIYKWLKKYDGNFDVVHFHDNGGPAFFATRAKAQGIAFPNTVLCVGAHGPHMWVLEWNRETVDSLVHLEVDEMERVSVMLSDTMISPSAYMPTWMQKNGWVLPLQSYVHPNILPTSVDSPIIPVLSAGRVPIKELVFFGRLERRKGLWIFLEALDLMWNDDTKIFEDVVITFLGKDTLFRDPTKRNKEIRASQEIEIHCAARGWNCIYLLTMDHVAAVQYLQYPGIMAVMPSPMDNSPNVVSECLMYGIPFIAFSVGGIPELIHPEDRRLVLCPPDADALASKLTDAIAEGAYRARIGMDPEARANVWMTWHSLATSPPRNYATIPSTPPSISIILTYNPEKWGANTLLALSSVGEQKWGEKGGEWEVVVMTKQGRKVEEGFLEEAQRRIGGGGRGRMRVEEHRADESDIVQLYSHAVSNVKSEYVVLMDPVSWLYGSNALEELLNVATRTRADIVTAQAVLNDTVQSVLLHIGSVGMYSSIVNCIGDWNVLVKRESFASLLPFERGDDIWRVYARAMMKNMRLESIPEPLFFQSIRISRDVDHRNVLEVNREFRPLFVRPYDTLVMVTQGFIKTKRLHDIEEESLRLEYESMAKELAQYKARAMEKQQEYSPLVPTIAHVGFLFVRGFEKSGTSWLRDVIRLHPQVSIAQWEFHFEIMMKAVSQFTSKHWQAAKIPYINVTRQWWEDFVPSLLAADIPEEYHSQIKWVGEKTPGPLEPVISGAKYVVIIRDGRDVAVSLFFHVANKGGFEGFCTAHGHLIPAEDVANYRKNNTYFEAHPEKLMQLEACVKQVGKMWADRIREDLATAKKLNEEMERSVHFVKYEELLSSCETEREKIYRFLDLDPSDAQPVDAYGFTAPGFGKDKPQNSFYRKGIAGDWKNFMVGKSKDWFKEVAGDVLIELGYESDLNW